MRWFLQGYGDVGVGDEIGRDMGVVQAINNFLVLELGKNVWVCYMIVLCNI